MKLPDKPVPVWMLTSHFFPVVGGAERQTQLISARLRGKFGWDVRVITRHQSNQLPPNLPKTETIDGIPVIRVKARSDLIPKFNGLVYFVAAFWHLLRYGRRSIYHAQDEFASAWLAVLASRVLSGYSLIKLRSGGYFYHQIIRHKRARKLFFFRLRLAHHLIVVNSEVKEFLLANGFPKNKITFVPNGIDTNYYRPPSASEKADARHRLGYNDHKVIVLYVGRLQHLKGPDILLDAWQNLPAYIHQRTLLVIAGDGPDYERLEQRDIPAVQMVGMQKDIRDFYWASNIFVLPSRTEGLSNALIEAMACGLPCVGSTTGGTTDIIASGETGYLFEAESVYALTQSLERVLRAPKEWEEVGARACARVKAYADIDTVSTRINQIYESLLSCDENTKSC